MEYPSKNDFFLSFQAIYNDKGEFIDYILINVSENFKKATNLKPEHLLGQKLSQLFVENKDNIIISEDFYYHMVPNARRKFERYIKEMDRWYLINIFSDDKNYLKLFYTDITKLKLEINKSQVFKTSGSPTLETINFDYYRDKLTGLYNKDFFEVELARLDTERQLPISIIIGDLNGLKLINDAFGHHMGNEALKAIGNTMKRVFRKEDIVSRFGGDEFVILLPKTDEETALSIVDRITNELSHNPLDFLHLSMSFGTSSKTDKNENMIDIMKKAEEKMYFNKLLESKVAKQNMISYLKDKLSRISFENKQHHERLECLSIMLANKLELSEIKKEEIRLLCKYHDIGKVGIPHSILEKPGPLNSEEWCQLKRHSEIGYHIMKASGETVSIDELILMHHERWDGKGYPGLLKGEEIPIAVRIFALADAYEAMVNDRPYKERRTHKEALQEIEDKAGTQFDPKLAKIFVELMESTNFKVI